MDERLQTEGFILQQTLERYAYMFHDVQIRINSD